MSGSFFCATMEFSSPIYVSDSGGGSLENAIIGCADLIGFSEWLIEGDNPTAKSKLIYSIFRIFSKFASKEYHTKLLGDGVLYIRTIKPHELIKKCEITEKFLIDTYDLIQEVKLRLQSKTEFHPLGIRARVTSGKVDRLYMDPPYAHDDFIGYPINFAARLLGIFKNHELVCSSEIANESKDNPLIRFENIPDSELKEHICKPPKGIIGDDLKDIKKFFIIPGQE